MAFCLITWLTSDYVSYVTQVRHIYLYYLFVAELNPPRLVLISSTTLNIYWDSPIYPNGIITSYNIYKVGDASDVSLLYTGGAHQLETNDSSLTPGRTYTFNVEVNNGAGGLNSSKSSIVMPPDSPPIILAPTNVTTLSAYDIYVEWMPVGDDVDQYRIQLNAGSLEALTRVAGIRFNMIVDRLWPYTEYLVQITACLYGVPNGCGMGPGVVAITHQAAPLGMNSPSLVAKGPSQIDITWREPSNPNGIITQYYIHRRLAGDNGQGFLITVLNGKTLQFVNYGSELKPYTEYEFSISAVNVRGEARSSWEKVRTLPALPTGLSPPTISHVHAYSLTISWTRPAESNGKIESYIVEYRQMVTIDLLIHKVSINPTFRTTTLSGFEPYTLYEFRVVAVNEAGEGRSEWATHKMGQAAPAGFKPFTNEKMVDGHSVIIRWPELKSPNGVIFNYIIYDETNVNHIYQGLTREFVYQGLEPYTSYTVYLKVCNIGGCARSPKYTFTTSEAPPSDIPMPKTLFKNATTVEIKWGKPKKPNGIILRYQILRRGSKRRVRRDTDDGEVVYETDETDKDEYIFIDTTIKPYMKYDYKVRVHNSQGQSDGLWMTVETDEAAPEGLLPPLVKHVGTLSDRLYITWTEPLHPNGIIQSYQIRKNGDILADFLAEDQQIYTDRGLAAFTFYSYVVSACTRGGCSTSNATVIQTPESAPYFVTPPTLITLNSSTIKATWVAPQVINGQIKEYKLLVDNNVKFTGHTLEYTVDGLTPYTEYQFILTACTYGGCADSISVMGRPIAAPPVGMRKPQLYATSATSVEVAWEMPISPNGIITSYEVRRDGVLVHTTQHFNYIDFDVKSGNRYSYTVTVFNSQGSYTSPISTIRTLSSAPVGLPSPTLEAVSSTSIRATWKAPSQSNGQIRNYTLYKDNDIVFSDLHFDTVIDGLDYWTQYSFRVQACTTNGCVFSEAAIGRTMESPPDGLRPPILTAYGDITGAHNGILIKWSQPDKPNGVITKYEVSRRNITALTLGRLLFSLYFSTSFCNIL